MRYSLSLTMARRVVGIVVCYALPGVVNAQNPTIGFSKEDTVVLTVPASFTTLHYTGLFSERKFDYRLRFQNGRLEALDSSGVWRSDWRQSGFPPSGCFEITKLKTVSLFAPAEDSTMPVLSERIAPRGAKRHRFYEVTLRIAPSLNWRLYMLASQAQGLRVALARARDADSVSRLAYDSLGSIFFVGPLAGFSPEERTALLRYAHVTASSTTIRAEEYKGITYLVMNRPSDASVWNDLQVNRNKRVGRLVSDDLAVLKAFGRIAANQAVIGGVKIEQPSEHGTAPAYSDRAIDRVEAYIPLPALLKFADAEMTSQQLVDQSTVLVNGDRISINLDAQCYRLIDECETRKGPVG